MTESHTDTTPPAPATPRIKRDRRITYRIPMEHFGLAALIEAAEATRKRAMGPLANVSAGGCCLVVTREVAERWTRGDHCTVHLPATERGLSYPSVLVAVEEWGETGQDMLLRLRFRKADAATQQQLTRWINELALQSWHR